MPPKTSAPSKKTEQKKLDKIVDDKTFGLKNKNKSKTVQNFVKSVANQVKGTVGKGGESKRIADEYAEKAAKKKEEEKKALLSNLFKSVKKVQEEVIEEPEEVPEESYQELDFYTDQREQIFSGEGEVPEELANWHNNKIDKMCRHFLEAAEAGKYGWRWICPNGLGCIYKHALPAGFTLKRDQPLEEKRLGVILEEELEIERALLTGGTPVTLERFLKWKEEKKIMREKNDEKKRVDEAKKSGGKGLNVLSGRALFSYDPTLFKDDEEALADEEYEEESEEEEEKQEEGIPEEDGEYEEEEEEEPKEAVIRDWGGDDGVTRVRATEVKAAGEGEEPKKKKKKKKKVKKVTEEEDDVKINEDVFLGEEDVELPEDDS